MSIRVCLISLILTACVWSWGLCLSIDDLDRPDFNRPQQLGWTELQQKVALLANSQNNPSVSEIFIFL